MTWEDTSTSLFRTTASGMGLNAHFWLRQASGLFQSFTSLRDSYCRDNLSTDMMSFALAPVTYPLSCLAKLSGAMPALWSSKQKASVRVPEVVIKNKWRNNNKIKKHPVLGSLCQNLSSLRCHYCCNKRTAWNALTLASVATFTDCWISSWLHEQFCALLYSKSKYHCSKKPHNPERHKLC